MPFLFARSPYLATRLQISPAAAAVPYLSVTGDASIPLRLAPEGSVPRPPPRRLLPHLRHPGLSRASLPSPFPFFLEGTSRLHPAHSLCPLSFEVHTRRTI
ncbi:hypothetical protein VPH35_111343 [Triticum aestivum]